MQLAHGTTPAGATAAPAFGSAMTFSASTPHSEGTLPMLRQHDTHGHSATVRTQAGGGGVSPCLTKLCPVATAGAVLLGAGLVAFAPPSLGHRPGASLFVT